MTADIARIFIGFDSKEVVAYHVLAQSIIEHATMPVALSPIVLGHLESTFTRERNALQSTEFSFSRFLVPYLSGFEGWSLFMDCDMLMRADIAELWSLRDEQAAVMCVQHDYQPKVETKFLGQVQTKYEKKNWSSVLLFNNDKCRSLTPDFVNSASGLELHQFKWLAGDDRIGELPRDGGPIVFHCKSGMRTAANAAQLGAAAGSTPAYILGGGIDAWRQAGQPTVADRSQPLEIMRQVQITAGAAPPFAPTAPPPGFWC